MTPRLHCAVVGCGRTCSGDHHFSEWLCSKHYPLVDRRLRRLRTRVKRKAAKYGWSTSLGVLAVRLWDRAKRQAIERAVGL